jgi:alkylated DNA repair dioxygenase AlkB
MGSGPGQFDSGTGRRQQSVGVHVHDWTRNYNHDDWDLNSPDYAIRNLYWHYDGDWVQNHDGYELRWYGDFDEYGRGSRKRHYRSVGDDLNCPSHTIRNLYWHYDGDWVQNHDGYELYWYADFNEYGRGSRKRHYRSVGVDLNSPDYAGSNVDWYHDDDRPYN